MGALDLFAERETVDLGLRILDHQIVGGRDQLLGNVDNLEIRETDAGLLVTGIVVGPGGLGARWPGRSRHWPPVTEAGHFGRWVMAVWRLLSPASDPQPLVLPMTEVEGLGSDIEVTDWGAAVLAGSAGLEIWLRRHLVGRLPGAKEGEDRLAGEPLGEAVQQGTVGLHPDGRLVTDLLGAAAQTAEGRALGIVLDIGCEAFERSEAFVGRLRVTSLLCGTHQTGARLGYAEDPHMGPWLLARLVRRLHGSDRRVPIGAVASIDWEKKVVTVRVDTDNPTP
jgi:hypothetical protein